MAIYKIIELQGIGETYAPKLEAEGIKTPEELLKVCAEPKGRKALAEKTGISGKLILKWTNHADLCRIDGIGPNFAELLEQVGVDTIKELSHRVPENLKAKIDQVNEAKKLVHRAPALKEIERWVAEAKTLPAMIKY